AWRIRPPATTKSLQNRAKPLRARPVETPCLCHYATPAGGSLKSKNESGTNRGRIADSQTFGFRSLDMWERHDRIPQDEVEGDQRPQFCSRRRQQACRSQERNGVKGARCRPIASWRCWPEAADR